MISSMKSNSGLVDLSANEVALIGVSGGSGDEGIPQVYYDSAYCALGFGAAAAEGFVNPWVDTAAGVACVYVLDRYVPWDQVARIQEINGERFIVDDQGVPHSLDNPDPTAAVLEEIVVWGSNLWDTALDGLGAAWDATVEFVGNAWDATVNFVGNAWDSTMDFVSDAWNAVSDWASNVWDSVSNFFGDMFSSGESYDSDWDFCWGWN